MPSIARLWDLEAKLTGQRVWQPAGQSVPKPLETIITLSIADRAQLLEDARRHRNHRIMKLLIGSIDDIALVGTVRQAAPHARIILDVGELDGQGLHKPGPTTGCARGRS